MNNSVDKPMAYIRKNRRDEAMIYLKENDKKAAQRLLCYMWATEHDVEVLGETTNIEEVDNCDVVLVASAPMLTRDAKEYYQIKNKLEKKGIRIEIVTNEDNADRYLEMMIQLSHNRRI